MTNESSIDSTRQGHEVSPRRAAREARRRAEALAQGLEAPLPLSDSAITPGSAASSSSATSAPSAQSPADAPDESSKAESDTAEPSAEELETRAQRSRSFAAAQRASSEGASRARREAMEAQRAAAERVRETLRANAVGPRRAARAASSTTATSAVTPDSPVLGTATEKTAPPSEVLPQSSRAASVAPFDQNASNVDETKIPSAEQTTIKPAAEAPTADTPAATQSHHVPPITTPSPRPSQPPAAQTPATSGRWDARNHETMSFGDILSRGGEANDVHVPAQAPAPSTHESGKAAAPVVEVEPVPETISEHVEHAEPAELAHEAHLQEAATTALEQVEQYPIEDSYPAHEPDTQYEDDSYYEEHAPENEDPHARENVFLTGHEDLDKNTVRKSRKRRRNGVMAVVVLGFIGVIVAVVLILQGVLAKFNPEDYPGPGGDAISFEVKSGWGTNQISKRLVADDIVASEKLFAEAVQLVETDNREIHPGIYELRKQMPALDAATILIGDGLPKVGYVAIKQNLRMPAVLEEVAKGSGLPLKDLQKLANDPKAFGIKSEAKNLEGYLHPGEYRFPVDSDAKSVLQMLVDATQKSLKDQGITDPAEGYRALKIASILQAEARPKDYAVVAGALENRLHPSNTETNGLLQVDSTVIYGLNRYTLQISKTEKLDAGNLYNSYAHKGLPPTPIGSPGDSAIKAAANPEKNDYYYWVTVNTNTGETKFAKTYREHLVNQNEFRAWCAQNTDVCK